MQTLEQQISAVISKGLLPIKTGRHIQSNLNPKFNLRPYQKEAFARFDYVINHYPKRQKPTQLLFHMATGSGKTLVMAGIIIDLYKQGYRNFIFFVNSSNIIDKTRDNFLNALSSKYLFNERISIAEKQINIKEVPNFETANQEDINIIFTTIQGLHKRLTTPKENALTFEDFENQPVVLISDEAHHINAETKKAKITKDEAENIISWEGTVNKIFNSNTDNLLLEFTATADLNHPEIAKKYHDKLLFDYPLKQFRKDKYSKEVKVLQAELSPFERALQAVILSQYRRKIFEKNKLDIKPVLLLKSKTINESKSFFDEFIKGIKTLTPSQIVKIKNNATNQVIKKAFDYFDHHKITIPNLISELQEDFSEDKCITINSKNDSDEKQLIINSLEDENNAYRAVFAVDKLNEGWDVLNLFDIVRLYNTRDTNHKTGKIGRTTMSEAQLIGRGARYCPFRLDETQALYQRKYDDDLDNELRVCEELYYHSAHNPNYIAELNKALEHIGMKDKKTIQKKLFLKESFKKTEMYQKGVLLVNKREVNKTDASTNELPPRIREKIYKVKFLTGYSLESNVFGINISKDLQKSTQIYEISSFGLHLLHKALNKLAFYRFNSLQNYFPNLKSINEFLTSDKYAKNIKVAFEGTIEQVQNPTNQMKLEAAIRVFDEISNSIPQASISYKGTKEFSAQPIASTFKDKILNFALNEVHDQEFGVGQSETTNQDLFMDLSKEDWYVFNDHYGTTEEKYFVKNFKTIYNKLSKKYDEIYLLKNEIFFKLYTFDEGQAIAPDFLLMLKNNTDKLTIYQLFNVSKGGNKLSNENSKIKEKFLLQLENEYGLEIILENKNYKLYGIPFNES